MFLIVSEGSKIKRNNHQSLAREAIKGTITNTTTQAVTRNVRGHHNAHIQA
jgi:hypothetical protein